MNGKQKWVVWVYSLLAALHFFIMGLCVIASAAFNLVASPTDAALLLGGLTFMGLGILCIGINNYVFAGVPNNEGQ
jgi:hypothetical protein